METSIAAAWTMPEPRGLGQHVMGWCMLIHGCGMLYYDVVLTLTAAATIDCP